MERPKVMIHETLSHMPKTEAELRQAVIDRLIAASVNNGQSAREAALSRWRALSPDCTDQKLS